MGTPARRSTGSIRKLPSGRYQVRYTDPDGSRQKAPRTFQTKAAAELELTRVLNSIDTGLWQSPTVKALTDFDPKAVTLRELAEHWRGLRVNRRGQPLSPNTLTEYARLVVNVLTPMADIPIRSITPQMVETWWGPQRRRAPNQAAKAYKHLNTLLLWAVKRKLIPVNPCDIDGATSYTPDKVPDVPTAKQVEIMLDVAPDDFRAVLALAAYGGLRKGEIFELRRKDLKTVKTDGETWVLINIDRGVIWQGKTAIVRPPKSPGSIRAIELPQRANAIIRKHLASIPTNPEALLFTRRRGSAEHWGAYQLEPVWRKVRAAAGFAGRFHSLRAYAATEFGKTGATSKELMDYFGHRHMDTAMRYQRTTGRERDLLRKLS
jgi:integrase